MIVHNQSVYKAYLALQLTQRQVGVDIQRRAQVPAQASEGDHENRPAQFRLPPAQTRYAN